MATFAEITKQRLTRDSVAGTSGQLSFSEAVSRRLSQSSPDLSGVQLIGADPFRTAQSTPAFVPEPLSTKDIVPSGLKISPRAERFKKEAEEAEKKSQGSFLLAGFGQVAKNIGQGIARSFLATGATIEEVAQGGDPNIFKAFKNAIQTAEFKPEGPIQEAIAGTTEPINFENIGKETLSIFGEEFAQKHKGIALPIGLLIAGLDVTPFGGTSKGAFQALKGANTVGDALIVLNKLGVADDLARTFADDVVKITNDKAAKSLFTHIAEVQKTTKVVPTKVIPKVTEPIKIPTQPTIVKTPKGEVINQIDLSNAAKITKTMPPLEPTVENAVKYQGFKGSFENFYTRFRTFLDDDWTRVKKLLKEEKFKVDPDFNPYDAKTRYYGRVGARIEQIQEDVRIIDKSVVKTSKKLKLTDTDFTKDINDYLVARHAPERNALHGDGAAGITTEAARLRVKEIEALPHFSKIKTLANEISIMNRKVLQTLLDGQVISIEQFNTLTKTYKNHVPLNRVFEESENLFELLSGRGFDVKGTGLKAAKGSELEVDDILKNVAINFEQATLRAEKNLVDLATLRFVRDNADLLKDVVKEGKPKAIGRAFAKAGEDEGAIILERITDPLILSLRENGKAVHLKFTDPHLAAAFRGVNRAKLDGLMRVIGSFTRFYSSLMTRFNPDFFLPNKVRDLQEAGVYLAAQGDFGFKGAGSFIKRQAKFEGERAVLNFLRKADTPDALLYKQMLEDGGTTGGLGLSTKKQVRLDVNEIRKTNRSKPRAAAKFTFEKIDELNQIFEDSTRFIVYKEALNKGLTRERAAVLAKESSIDFNRMGTGGPVINGLYMFANASIQGSVKMLRAMRNPKVAGTVVSVVGASVWAVNEWNDSVDHDWRNKVSKWDRLNALNVIYPTTDGITYFSIPVSWGIKPIKVMMEYASDLAAGKAESFDRAMSAIFASVVEGYNPVGGTDISSAITPTIADIPVAIARNTAWHGGKIRPDWDPNAPSSELYFTSLERSAEGQVAITTTKSLAEKGIEISPADAKYAYEQLIGGTGRFVSKVANTISGILTDEVEIREVPFVSRFLRRREEEQIGAGSEEFDQLKSILTEQSRERIQTSRLAEHLFDELSELPPDEANARVDDKPSASGDFY